MKLSRLAVCVLLLAPAARAAENLPEAVPPALAPLDAAARMSLPPGFKVSLFAGEPDVLQPIAMTFDDRGRLWVVECFSYPEKIQDRDDRVVIFEDTDNDGRFNKRTVFWDKGVNCTGIEYGFGGIWLTATPNLLFIPDRDGDDKPDGEPQIVLDGFDLKARHNKVNGLAWGPDGWLYGMNGILSNSLLGPPGTPDAERTPMNCGVWRWHPTKHRFEVVAHGTTNPWGLDFDQNGQLFITNCVIEHVFHVTPGSRFKRMFGQDFNPHTYQLMETCADHIHWAGGPWQESRGNQPKHSDAGGGHAHVGCLIYQGQNWPAEYHNNLFTCNIHGLRVNRDVLEPKGSSYVAHHGADFLKSADTWFRGISIKTGPDGGVYLSDWSDTGECHNYKEVDRTNGRIYKITYGEHKTTLGKEKPVAEWLAELWKNDAALGGAFFRFDTHWMTSHARRILQERAAENRLPKLPFFEPEFAKSFEERPKAAYRPSYAPLFLNFDNLRIEYGVETLWALHVANKLNPDALLAFTKYKEPYARGWAVQLALEDRQATPAQLARFAEMAKSDPSPVVRRFLAAGLQRLPLDDRWSIAEELVSHAEDAAETNLTLLYWYGIEPLVPANQARARELLVKAKIPLVREFIARRLGSLATGDDTLPTLTPVVDEVAKSSDPNFQRNVLKGLQDSFTGRREVTMPLNWPATYRKLLASADSDVRERATVLSLTFGDPQALASLRQTLSDPKAELPARENALAALLQKKDEALVPLLHQLLLAPELRGPAVRALAAYNAPSTPQLVLAQYAHFTDSEKRDAIGTLASRPSYAVELLAAIEQEKISHSDLSAYIARQLAGYRDAGIDARLAKVWGEVRATSEDKKKKISDLKTRLTKQLKKADVTHGRFVFSKTCASCHIMFDAGTKIGPDLTGSQRANLDYVLENLVDPNAVIGRDYQMTLLQTTDGRVINGIIREENENAVTLQTPTDRIVVPKNEIEERVRSPISMMPEELLTKLSSEDLRDLVGYLASPAQVPLPPAETK